MVAAGDSMRPSRNGAPRAGKVYSIDGPWSWTEEEDLLKLYELKPVSRLDGAYMFDDADGGVGIVVRAEAIEKIRQLRITLYGTREA